MRFVVSAMVLVAGLLMATPSLAHHGWSWTSGKNIDLTGVIESAQLGNPHGVLKVSVEGETWTVEVGQPWRNERAGLVDGDLAPGVEFRVIGEPSADISDRRVKAERIYINGREYKLYPERD